MHKESYINLAKNLLTNRVCETCIWRFTINDSFSFCRRNLPKNWQDLGFDQVPRVKLNDTCPFWFDRQSTLENLRANNKQVSFVFGGALLNTLNLKEIKKIVRQENGNA